MSLRTRVARALGAEKDMGCWHYPRYTEGCWGKRTEKLCWLCRVRYPLALLRILRRHKT